MTKKDITNILGVFIIITTMTTTSSASIHINIVAFVNVKVITTASKIINTPKLSIASFIHFLIKI